MIYALRRFRIYFQGIPFKLVTDCNALKLTLDKKDVNRRISGWALELETFDKIFEHRSGEKMKHVDAFSRANNVMIIEDNTLELNLVICQNRDVKIQELCEKLEKSEDKLFEMRNGLVYRKRNDDILFYVTEKMENHILRKYHYELGHVCAEKTTKTILSNYWFQNIVEKIKLYVANCLKCIAFSPSGGKGEGCLNPIPKGETPFLTYHVDHLGPIEKKIATKQHVFVIIDAFTKFVRLYPVKTTETKETVNCLTEYFKNYSRPRTIVSDRGTCFMSQEFKEFMDDNKINHMLIATASPKANGQVERINRVITPMLAKLSDPSSGKYWYKMLTDVEFALNNTIHSTVGVTPSKLLFGINQRGSVIDPVAEYLEQTKHSGKDTRNLEQIRFEAIEKIKKSQEYNKAYFDKKHKESRKYQIGPYEVVKVLRNDRCSTRYRKFSGNTKSICRNLGSE